MTEEKLFKFAKEKGWHEVLEVCRTVHSLKEVAVRTNRSEKDLLIEFNAMRALGLLALVKKVEGGYAYIPTGLGLKLLQEKKQCIK